jgi:hypothetical protein
LPELQGNIAYTGEMVSEHMTIAVKYPSPGTVHVVGQYHIDEHTSPNHIPLMFAAIDAAISEILNSNRQHGQQINLPDLVWNAIASEEAGEATKAALQAKLNDELINEVIQAAAMYLKWLMKLLNHGPDDWRSQLKDIHAT